MFKWLNRMDNNIHAVIKIVLKTQISVLSAIRKVIFQEIVQIKTNEVEPQEIKDALTVMRMVIFLVIVHSLKKNEVREDKMETTLSVSSVTKWVIFHVIVQTIIKMINKSVVVTTSVNEETMVVHSNALQKVVLYGAMMKMAQTNKITGVTKTSISKTLQINLTADGVRPQEDEKKFVCWRDST